MPDNETVVQPETVVNPTASIPAVTPQPAPAVSASDIEARIAKMLDERVEAVRRQVQSKADQTIFQTQKELRAYKSRLDATEAQLGVVRTLGVSDPDMMTKMRAAELDARERNLRTQDVEEQQARAQQEFQKEFVDSMKADITELGVDPDDKRIDWATDAPSALAAKSRILKSAAKIVREKTTVSEAQVKSQVDAAVAKMRKDLGLDVVDISNPAPAGGGTSDDAFIKAYSEGEKNSPEDHKRARKIFAN